MKYKSYPCQQSPDHKKRVMWSVDPPDSARGSALWSLGAPICPSCATMLMEARPVFRRPRSCSSTKKLFPCSRAAQVPERPEFQSSPCSSLRPCLSLRPCSSLRPCPSLRQSLSAPEVQMASVFLFQSVSPTEFASVFQLQSVSPTEFAPVFLCSLCSCAVRVPVQPMFQSSLRDYWKQEKEA